MAGHLTAGPTHQVSGPVWLNDDSECFDISAKALAETPKAQIRAMVQTLLTERFKLALHRETRELPIYVLETARRGPRLSSSGPGRGPLSHPLGGRKRDRNECIDDRVRLSALQVVESPRIRSNPPSGKIRFHPAVVLVSDRIEKMATDN